MKTLICAGCAGAVLWITASQGAQANGVFENRSWSFRTSADRAADAVVLEMIQLKKGGFYDSATVNNNNNYTTHVYGHQYNCAVAPQATGNSAANFVDAVTSSPEVAPGSDFTSDATGNETENWQDTGGALNNAQNNEESQNAGVDNNTATSGDTTAGGGATDQVLNNTQTNSGDQTVDVNESQACSFAGEGTGAGSPTATQTINPAPAQTLN